MVLLDAKDSNLNKDDKHRNHSSHFLIVTSLPPFLAWADSQYCSQLSRWLLFPQSLEKAKAQQAWNSDCCYLGIVTVARWALGLSQLSPFILSNISEMFPKRFPFSRNVSNFTWVTPQTCLYLLCLSELLPCGCCRRERLGAVAKVRYYEDARSGEWMHL